jgi:3-hydroxymyristoyl/3-hydroxydecanoyl-(acyl carrier protein) dehydratase
MRHAERTVQAHETFLEQQTRQLKSTAFLFPWVLDKTQNTSSSPLRPQKALYTREQIRAFANGNHRACFGNQYGVFGRRRIPCLPRGELQLMGQVIDLNEPVGSDPSGSTLVSQIDIPIDAWYLADTPYLPHFILMEIALQPCGFLSAHLGSILDQPEVDFYFRNLNGEGTLHHWPIQVGSTITNHVELISSIALNESIIQTYNFQLSTGGCIFYTGNSSFGYFPPGMLANQVGLDRGNPQSNRAFLPRVKQLWCAPRGGDFQQGYLYLSQDVNPQAWYFQDHFYQDPVMPGSLGVELMARALMSGSQEIFHIPSTSWRIKPRDLTTWKYRGQILPRQSLIQIELHIKDIQEKDSIISASANCSLWKDDIRIYSVENLSIETLPGERK